LDVVVPPDILNQPDLDGMTMEAGVTNEGGSIQLVCQATGVPEPHVQWRREGGKEIFIRNEGRDKQSNYYLEITFYDTACILVHVMFPKV
jgi:hypothetical protein